MADSPEEVLGGGADVTPWQFLLRPLNRLFGFGQKYTGPRGDTRNETILARRNAGASSGTGVFSRAPGAKPPAPLPQAPGGPTAIDKAARPGDGARIEPYRGPPSGGRGRKKRKKSLADRIRDQLAKEALYYAQNPVELLRVMPHGRTLGGRGRPRLTGKMPPSYQRGAVAAQGLGPRPSTTRARRARPGPRAGRIGQERPRASPKPVEPIRAPSRAGAANPAAKAARADKLQPQLKASDVARNLPFTDYDAEGLNQPAPVARPGAQPGAAPGRAPGPGANRASPVRKPAAARAPAARAAALARALPSIALESLLRAATRRSPRVSAVRSAAPRGSSLPIGDFPTASPTPARVPGSDTGFAQGLSPFPVPRYAYDYDKCNCPKPKKRKPRQPRTVCRAGSYTQTAKGIQYRPNREVPCS